MTKNFFGGEIPPHISFRIANGELISAILKSAEKFRSDLIIIKKAGRMRGFFSFFRKENADRLIGALRRGTGSKWFSTLARSTTVCSPGWRRV